MDFFLLPELWPFLLASLLLVLFALMEALGLLIGLSLSGWLDQISPDIDLDAPDIGHGFGGFAFASLDWLHIGRVPILIILTTFLTSFSLSGYMLNGLSLSLLGSTIPTIIAALLALIMAIFSIRLFGNLFIRFFPGDESSAEPLSLLVGKIAIIINGTARPGYPAQARVKNSHGLTLYVHVEPETQEERLGEGESVLLVRQISGARFLAIANPRPDLLQ